MGIVQLLISAVTSAVWPRRRQLEVKLFFVKKQPAPWVHIELVAPFLAGVTASLCLVHSRRPAAGPAKCLVILGLRLVGIFGVLDDG